MEILCDLLPEYTKIGKIQPFIEDLIGKDYNWANMKPIYCAKTDDEDITHRIYKYGDMYILEEEEKLEGLSIDQSGFEYWGIEYDCYYTEISLINS